MRNKIIALIGVIGSGKDYYKKSLKYDKNIGFSDGVREYTWATLDWEPKDEFEYESFKTSKILSFIKTVGIKELHGRELMENLATKLRQFDNSFWAKVWAYKAEFYLSENKGVTLVAHDCRYPEEAANIFRVAKRTDSEVEFIFLNYKSEKYEIRNHESEYFAQYFLNSGCQHLENITEKVKLKINESSKI